MILAVVACLGSAGCEKKAEQKTEDGIVLKWVCPGPGKQQDSDMVWSKFNEKLQEYMPGVSVEFEIIPMADYNEKWKLMSAASTPIDIAWLGYVNDIQGEIQKGALLELDDLIDQYAPDYKRIVPDVIKPKYDGKQYLTVNYQMCFAMRYGIRSLAEYVDNYMDEQQVEALFQSNNKITQEGIDAIAEYLEKLKQDDKLGTGVSPTFSWIYQRGYYTPGSTSELVFMDYDSDAVYTRCDLPELSLMHKTLNEWYQKGYIREDILSVDNPRDDDNKIGGNVIWVHNDWEGQEKVASEQTGAPVKIISLDKGTRTNGGSSATCTVLPRTCRYPKESMELINLLCSEKGKELYNLLVYGIEDVHYKKINDERIETIGYSGTTTSDNKYGLTKWIMGNTFNSYLTQTDEDGYLEYIREMTETAVPTRYCGFTFESDPVKTQVAQCKAVVSEYSGLMLGAHNDYEKLERECNEKLKKAGIDIIRDEVISQYNKWKEENNA